LKLTERGVPDKLGVDALNDAKRYGARIALDDVGEGSNLVVLSRCRVEYYQNRQVRHKANGIRQCIKRQYRVIAALMNIADLEIIAEGVESAMQVVALENSRHQNGAGMVFLSFAARKGL